MNWINVKDKPLCIYEGEYDLEILVKEPIFAVIESKIGLEYLVVKVGDDGIMEDFAGYLPGWDWEEIIRYVPLAALIDKLDAKLPHN